MASLPSCSHLESAQILPVSASERTCAECVKTGSRWVHLRKCLSCGIVLCCDSSPNRHATAHFKQSGHPVAMSAEPGERWAWCYADQLLARY
ncbi:MAG: UBP-type zinc finger domain-containing protein [Bacteroidia bacterium]|nr:UBP-type zinc finger domain-containing protein [Bacteroidia bacterium]